MTHAVGLALVSLGCAVAVLATVGAAVMPGGVFNRLHFLTPVTSAGVPSAAVGLAVESGRPFTVAELLFVAVVVGASGPVLESATGRVAALDHGLTRGGQPE